MVPPVAESRGFGGTSLLLLVLLVGYRVNALGVAGREGVIEVIHRCDRLPGGGCDC
jgi:hypothetical protein